MSQIRLDKFLANEGAGTRTQVKALVRSGRVRVNGVIAGDSGMKINDEFDRIEVDGELMRKTGIRYIMLHKPAGVISATADARQKTVLDLLGSEGTGTSPAGRLDIDTEGLLLLTDDGEMIHDLLSPKKHVDKTYLALVDGHVSDELIQSFREGMDISDEKVTLPALLDILQADQINELVQEQMIPQERQMQWKEHQENPDDKGSWSWTKVTIHEGRFHQIKRMFGTASLTVIYLKRLSMGPLTLDPKLAPGDYRHLSEDEVAALKNRKR